MGVGYAHDLDVLHRDLKPANILLGGHGEVLVVDWGIARFTPRGADGVGVTDSIRRRLWSESRDARRERVRGSPPYMAPEQVKHPDQVGAAADVFCLGVILYEILTRFPPFSGKDVEEVVEPSATRSRCLPGSAPPTSRCRRSSRRSACAASKSSQAIATRRRRSWRPSGLAVGSEASRSVVPQGPRGRLHAVPVSGAGGPQARRSLPAAEARGPVPSSRPGRTRDRARDAPRSLRLPRPRSRRGVRRGRLGTAQGPAEDPENAAARCSSQSCGTDTPRPSERGTDGTSPTTGPCFASSTRADGTAGSEAGRSFASTCSP